MHTKLNVLGVALACLAAGSAGGAFLHAQTATSPAYVLAEVQVKDPETFKQYLAALPGTLAPYKVRTLARGNPVALDASTPPAGSFVILGFNSMDDVKAWWDSPGYQAIIPLREKSSTTRAYAVQGVPPS